MTILIQTGTTVSHEHAHYSCVIYFKYVPKYLLSPFRYVKQYMYFFLEYLFWNWKLWKTGKTQIDFCKLFKSQNKSYFCTFESTRKMKTPICFFFVEIYSTHFFLCNTCA